MSPRKANRRQATCTRSLPLALLAILACAPAVLRAQDCEPWSDPATWDGSPPALGQLIEIPVGRCVSLDTQPPPLAGLVLNGTLRFLDTDDRLLRTGWILVNETGALEIGRAKLPFQHSAQITLIADDTAEEVMPGMGTRGILVMGGRLALYGRAPKPVWTRLAAHAAAGASELQLETAVDWLPGDRIVVAPTDFYGVAETETRNLAGLNDDRSRITLATPLSRARWGRLQYPAPGTAAGLSLEPAGHIPPRTPAPAVLDERAEVGNLSRSILVQAPDDALWREQGFGAHIMIMGSEARVVIDGVRLRRVGQAGRNGRYPLHWHLLSYDPSNGSEIGDASGHVVRNSSIGESANRCVTIHGTNGVTVSDTICHDIRGHAIFLEDAVERRNLIRRNLVLKVRNPAPADVLQQHESGARHPFGASGMWITNPDNTIAGNVVADVAGIGYWLSFPQQPLGLSKQVAISPRHTLFGRFEDNTVHSVNGLGVDLDDASIDDAGNTLPLQYQPTADNQPPGEANPGVPFRLRRLTTWKNRGCFWNRAYPPVYEEFVAADCTGKFFEGSTSGGFIRRSLVVGTSLNDSRTWESMAADPVFSAAAEVMPPVAFASYHGGVAMHYNTVINFPFIQTSSNTAFGSAPSGVFANDDYYIRPVERSLQQNRGNLRINAAPGSRSVPRQPNFVFAGAIHDPQGLFGPRNHYWVYDTPFLTGGSCVDVPPAGTNGKSCGGRYFGAEAFVLDHANEPWYPLMEIAVTRRASASRPDRVIGEWQVDGVPAGDATNFMLPNMRHFAMRGGGIYVLDFPSYEGPLTDVSMVIGNMRAQTDTVVLAVRYHGEVAHVFATTYEGYARDPSVATPPGESTPYFRAYTPVGSRAALLGSAGETFYHDVASGLVWIRLRGGVADAFVADPLPFSDETLYQPFVLRIHDEVAQ